MSKETVRPAGLLEIERVSSSIIDCGSPDFRIYLEVPNSPWCEIHFTPAGMDDLDKTW